MFSVRKKEMRSNKIETHPYLFQNQKQTQQMQGEQMLEGAKKYNASSIAALRPEFQDQITIKNLNKQGNATMKMQYKFNLQAAWEERKSKKLSRSTNQLDLFELEHEAAQALSKHNKSVEQAR